MKKLFKYLLPLAITSTGFALPLGNPLEAGFLHEGVLFGPCDEPTFCLPCKPDFLSLRLGFYGDYVFNRHMKVDRSADNSDIRNTELFTNAGYFALNFCNRVDLYGALGTTHIYIDSPGSAFLASGAANGAQYWESDTAFSWSLGARATLINCGCFGLGIQGAYFTTDPRLNYAYTSGAVVTNYFNEPRIRYREWQVGLGASYVIPIGCCSYFAPYIGGKWAHAHIGAGNPQTTTFILYDLKNQKRWGFATGVTFIAGEKIQLTGEVRFADEKAAYVNFNCRL